MKRPTPEEDAAERTIHLVSLATQRHQDHHAPERETLRWHCGGSDCGREIGRNYLDLLAAVARGEDVR